MMARSASSGEIPDFFLTPRGCRFTKGAIHRYFGVVRAAYGRADLDFYELCHACAALLLDRGLSPDDVAIQLGHTDGGGLVRRLYGHPSEDRARSRITAAFEHKPVADLVAAPPRDRLTAKAVSVGSAADGDAVRLSDLG